MIKTVLLSGALVGASIGGCGQKRLPPSPAEQRSSAAESDEDRYAGLPPECRELMEECPTCDEVERTRRKIEAKKCVPVCDAFVERSAEIGASVPAEGIELLKADALCGKEGASCSPIEDSACGFAIAFTDDGRGFRAYWADDGAPPAPDEILDLFYRGFLKDYFATQDEILTWAKANEVDPGPILEAGGKLMKIQSTSALNGVAAEVGSVAEADEVLAVRFEATKSLLRLITEPGDPTSLKARRDEALTKFGVPEEPENDN